MTSLLKNSVFILLKKYCIKLNLLFQFSFFVFWVQGKQGQNAAKVENNLK